MGIVTKRAVFSTDIPEPVTTFLSLGYSGDNTVRSVATATFSQARTDGDITQANIVVGCYLENINELYVIHRAFGGFNTTGATSAISGGIRINISTNNLLSSVNFGIVRTTVSHPYNYVWGIGDFADSLGGTLVTGLVSIGSGGTGNVTFPFNAAGLSYINGNNDCSFAIIQYTNDGLNVAPSISLPQIISGASANFQLYYTQ